MSGISPTNIQHILQVGTATEKLQHALQNIPHAAGQQHKEERKVSDEVKRTTVQSSEESNQSNTVNSDGSRRNQAKNKNKNSPAEDQDTSATAKGKNPAPEEGQGRNINLVV
jgi:hypothetical protein